MEVCLRGRVPKDLGSLRLAGTEFAAGEAASPLRGFASGCGFVACLGSAAPAEACEWGLCCSTWGRVPIVLKSSVGLVVSFKYF